MDRHQHWMQNVSIMPVYRTMNKAKPDASHSGFDERSERRDHAYSAIILRAKSLAFAGAVSALAALVGQYINLGLVL